MALSKKPYKGTRDFFLLDAFEGISIFPYEKYRRILRI